MDLFKQLDDTLSAIEPRFGRRIQIRAELCKRRQLTELRQIELHFASDLLDRFDLRGRTDTAD